MAKLSWDLPEKRRYEVGVDRGVLFPDSTYGVAWPGLKAVSEKLSGGDITSYYLDGKRYRNQTSPTEFSATISAFSAPREFDPCDGIVWLAPGLSQTHQRRRRFSFAYRTLLGNSPKGVSYGYKLHLVYNAEAKPTERNYTTRSDSASPTELSWEIETVAPFVSGMTPTAHLVFSSARYGSYILSKLEDLLYGTSTTDSKLPTMDDIQSILATKPGYGHGPYGHLPYGA